MASITIKGIEALTHKLDKIDQMEQAKKCMDKAVLMVHSQAKLLAPVDTGDLAGSIHFNTVVKGTEIIGKVYTNKVYAPFVEFGTGIKGNGTYPNKKIKLTYRSTPWVYTPNDGEDFYYTEGQVAQPYMYPAIKQNEKKIKAMFKEALHTEISK